MGFCAKKIDALVRFCEFQSQLSQTPAPCSLTARARRFPVRVLPRTGISILAVDGSPSRISESKNQPSPHRATKSVNKLWALPRCLKSQLVRIELSRRKMKDRWYEGPKQETPQDPSQKSAR